METLVFDLRNAVRSLRRTSPVTVLAVLTLSLGVGANTAMFGLVDGLLFGLPEHVDEPREVGRVTTAESWPRFQDLREHARTVDVAAYTQQDLGLGAGPDAVPIVVECVTAGYFPLLGVEPLRGRGFVADEDVLGGPRLAVLSHGLWQRQLGGDPGVVGTTVRIARADHTVIGVMPPGFSGVEMEAVDAWTLLATAPEACSFTGRSLLDSAGGAWLETIARPREGFTFEQARVELAGLDWTVEVPMPEGRSPPETELVRLYGREDARLGRSARMALWLAAGAGLVFVIACLNVAGLLSIRAIQRRREIAVRLQLGATRPRIAAWLLAESLVLAVLCGLVAVVVGTGLRLLIESFYPLRPADALLDGRLLLAMVSFTFLAGLLSGAAPALQAARTDPGAVLRGGASTGGDGSRLRGVLIVGQVALSLVLLVCAGLFVRSIDRLEADPGYEWDRVVVVSVDLRKAGYPDAEVRPAFDRMMERVLRLPDVESASIGPPILGSSGPSRVAPLRGAGDAPEMAMSNTVSPGYFATLGTAIVRGRPLGEADAGRDVAVVDEELARTLWPDEEAVGQCAESGFGDGPCLEIVGVSESRRHGSLTSSMVEFFVPLPRDVSDETSFALTTLLVRTRTPPAEAAGAIAAAIHDAEPDLPFADVRPLADLVDEGTRSWRMGATLFGLFGLLAVLLGGVGVYGVLALSVRQRVPEIGVCMALGATTRDVMGTVLRRGAVMVTVGLVLGVAAAAAATRYIESLLYEVAPGDVPTFAAALVVVVLVALAGCFVPATRAARVDPAVALRNE